MKITTLLLATLTLGVALAAHAEGGKNVIRTKNLVCDLDVKSLTLCVTDAGYHPADCEVVMASPQSGFTLVRCEDPEG